MRRLYVATTPTADADAVVAIRDALGPVFGLPVAGMEIPEIDYAYDVRRGQYASILVLESLTRAIPSDAAKLLAITGRDLFIPVLTFVFGQAQLNGRVGVVSLARLRQEFYGLPPDGDVFLRRAATEALHETGHMFGLVHCADLSCAMSLSTGVRQIDRKEAAFCKPCSGRIRRPDSEREQLR
jgi:archaemetzincin